MNKWSTRSRRVAESMHHCPHCCPAQLGFEVEAQQLSGFVTTAGEQVPVGVERDGPRRADQRSGRVGDGLRARGGEAGAGPAARVGLVPSLVGHVAKARLHRPLHGFHEREVDHRKLVLPQNGRVRAAVEQLLPQLSRDFLHRGALGRLDAALLLSELPEHVVMFIHQRATFSSVTLPV